MCKLFSIFALHIIVLLAFCNCSVQYEASLSLSSDSTLFVTAVGGGVVVGELRSGVLHLVLEMSEVPGDRERHVPVAAAIVALVGMCAVPAPVL